MGKQFAISKEELARLYYQEGLSCPEIGARYGVSDTTVSNRMREYGMERRSNYIAIPKETLEQLYYEEGLNQKEIAERLGLSDSKVRHQMQEYGLNARGKLVDIPQEEVARLYYEEGLTQEQIGEIYGVSFSGISQRMRKWGMETRTQSDYKIEIQKELLEELYYNQRLTLKQIAEIFGVTDGTVANRMKEYGMKRRKHSDYTYIDIPKEELCQLYVEYQMTVSSIAEIYGCAVSSVYKRLAEHGIELRPLGSDKLKRIVPDERLEWSPDFAYVIGLVATDGNLRRDANEVKFYSTDHELTENYCRALGLRPDDISPDDWDNPDAVQVHVYHDTRHKEYKPQFHVVFSDYIYRAKLEDIGLTPNKSNTLNPLAIPDEYFRDFLRAVFDGDGCWCVSRGEIYGIITSGSPRFRRWLLDTIWRLTPITTGTIYNIDVRFQGRAAEELANFIYYRPDLPALSRKRGIWEEWMQNKPQYKKLR